MQAQIDICWHSPYKEYIFTQPVSHLAEEIPPRPREDMIECPWLRCLSYRVRSYVERERGGRGGRGTGTETERRATRSVGRRSFDRPVARWGGQVCCSWNVLRWTVGRSDGFPFIVCIEAYSKCGYDFTLIQSFTNGWRFGLPRAKAMDKKWQTVYKALTAFDYRSPEERHVNLILFG